MTRGAKRDTPGIPEDVPGAIYTISKNVLGRNVTDTIAPLVREALPGIAPGVNPDLPVREVIDKSGENFNGDSRSCRTPDGSEG